MVQFKRLTAVLLSVMLVMGMFTVPVFADSADFSIGAEGGDNITFSEIGFTEETDPTAQYGGVYGTEKALKNSRYVVFTMTASQAGTYDFTLNLVRSGLDGQEDNLDVYLNNVKVDTLVYSAGVSKDTFTASMTKGTNTLRFEGKPIPNGHKVTFDTMNVTKTGDMTTHKWRVYKKTNPDNFTGSLAIYTEDPPYNATAMIYQNTKYTFPLELPYDGSYLVKAYAAGNDGSDVGIEWNGTEVCSCAVETDGNATANLQYVDIGVMKNMTAGAGEITFVGKNLPAYVRINEITVEYLQPGTFSEMRTRLAQISTGETIARGTDRLELKFTNPMTVDGMSFTLTDGVNTIPVKATASGNSIFANFKKTLDKNASYTLSWTGIKDAYGYDVADGSFGFSTDNDESEGDAAKIVKDMSNSGVNGADATFKAYMQSADNIGIAGRVYSVTLKDPDGNPVSNASLPITGVSGDGGAVTGNYTFNDDLTSPDASGEYTFVLDGEYVSTPEEIKLRFISTKERNNIAGTLALATTANEVSTLFSQPLTQVALSINPTADLAGIGNTEAFYNHFVGKTYNDVPTLITDYNKYLNLEKINQFTVADDLEAVFNDDAAMTSLGLDKGRFTALATQKDAFLAEVMNAATPNPDTFEGLQKLYTDLTNKHMLNEYSLTQPSFSASIPDVKVGQEFELTAKLSQETDKVKEIQITIDEATAELSNNNIVVTPESIDSDVTTEVVNGNLLVKITYRSNAKVLNIGTVKFESPFKNSANASFNVSAKIIYEAQGSYSPELESSVISCPVDVATSSSKNPPTGSSKDTAPKRGGSGSGVGGSAVVIPDKEEEPVVENKPFSDLDKAAWAETSILTLYKKNIIDGYEGKFNPGDNVTRAQFAKMVVNALGLTEAESEAVFEDVASNHWSYSYVSAASKYGLILGNNGLFRGEDNITREDMCVIMYRAWQKRYGDETIENAESFADEDEISEYAKAAVAAMRAAGVVNGVGDNMFMPAKNATRAEAAHIIARFMEEMNL